MHLPSALDKWIESIKKPPSAPTIEEPERGHWSGKFDFLLACLGTAVGLGNVWRFPSLTFVNGGGAFLIPYIIMVFLIGLPVFLVELALGQYSAMGPLKVFQNISPIFKGLGYAMILAASMVAIYYNMIIAWTLFYFFDSFRSAVRWSDCSHDFNTPQCFEESKYKSCLGDNSSNVFYNRTCYNVSTALQLGYETIGEHNRSSPTQEYFYRYALDKSSSFMEIGSVKWDLALCLLAAWIIVAGALIKGIKTSGKVVYFTATFPYLILVILFIQGLTLEGSGVGLKYYLQPDFSRLSSIQVWKDAAIQVFYSFSIAGGGMITYASYNRYNNNLIRDVLIIGIGDMLTSIFSGLVVFSMLGYMSVQLEKPIAEVVESRTGLAFIVYPQGISMMPVPILWALLFFFMLFLLGIDSQFAMVETLITFVFDQFPSTRSRKPLVVAAISTILFLLGLPLTCQGGVYLLDILDNYAAGWPYLFIGTLECLVIAYFYGIDNFFQNLRDMTGWDPNWWVRVHLLVTIVTICPLVIGVILVVSWVDYEPLNPAEYGWGNTLGWVLAFVPIVSIFLAALHELAKTPRGISWSQKWHRWTQPTPAWSNNANSQLPKVQPTQAYDNPGLTDLDVNL